MWYEWLAMTLGQGKVLLHLSGRRQRVVDADDIYYLEAQGDETDVRLRSARRLRDVRSLGEVLGPCREPGLPGGSPEDLPLRAPLTTLAQQGARRAGPMCSGRPPA